MNTEGIEKGKIALCIFTYNHADIVRNMLLYCAEYYTEAGIDFYYLDGSENDDTKVVIDNFISMGYTNISYLHNIDEYEGQRTDLLVKGKVLKKDYDYIWISKDSTFVSKSTLQQALKCTEDEPDIIAFGFGSGFEAGVKTYDDAALYYRDFGWLATSMDITIWNTKTVFQGFGIDKYPLIFGIHYIHIFTKLSELNPVKIEVIIEDNCPTNGFSTKSSWENRIFHVWKDDWIEANQILPSCYDPYKAGTIKKGGTLPWIFGTVARIQELHDRGTLVPEILDQVRVNWEMVSDVPFYIVEDIANGTYVDDNTRAYNETLNLLSKINEYVSGGLMNRDQVPFDDIKDLIINTIGMQSHNDEGIKNHLEKSIDDLTKITDKYNVNQDDLGKIIHLMTTFVLISK